MKVGLLLEGGAMRGMYTAGVLDVLMENDIKADIAVGVSAGAAFGCNYKSGQIGRAVRYNTRFSRDPRYMGLKSLITTGDLYGADFCYREIPDKLDLFDYEAYRLNPMQFYVVCIDVETGGAVYHENKTSDETDMKYLRASASMPLVSKVVEVEGRKLLDGGVVDSIPIEWMKKQGVDRIIAVLTREEGYVKKKRALLPLAKLALSRYPKLAQAMERRPEEYNRALAEVLRMEAAGELFLFRPKVKPALARTERDPEKLRALYEVGRQEAEEKLDALKKYLAE